MAKINFTGKIKEFLGRGNNLGVEFVDPNDDQQLKSYIEQINIDAFEAIQKKTVTWQENKKAYLAEGVEQVRGKSTIYGDSGIPNIYCSAILADKIEAQASIQLNGRPIVYPLPAPSETFDFAPLLTGDETPGDFTRKVWTNCFKDLRERRRFQTINHEIAIESRLCGIAVMKVTQAYDFEVQRNDVKLEVCLTEDVAFDPDCKEAKDARYVLHRLWKTPYELMVQYPEFKKDIAESIREADLLKKYNNKPYELDKIRRGLVCVVECYLRDLTQETIKTEVADEVGNLDIEETVRFKYPTGRRITFLEGKQIKIFKDESNPYKSFPFVVFCTKPVNWSIHGRNESSPLRALQFMDDFVYQQMMVNLKSSAWNKLIYDRKGVPNPELIEAFVEKIPVDYLGSITFHQAQGIANDSITVHNSIEDNARMISGIEAASEGRANISGTSGIAVSMIQEGTNSKLRPVRDLYVEFLVDVWKQVADIMIDLYREGMILRVTGEDDLPVRLPCNLIDITDSIDVKADSDTQLPSDPVSLLNFALSLMQIKDENGVPIIDRYALYDLLNIPGFKEAMERVEGKSQQVAAQNQELAQQQMAAKQGSQDSQGVGQMNPTNQMMGMANAPSNQPGNGGINPSALPPELMALMGGQQNGQ